MAQCDICGKTVTRGNKISIARSHVSRRATRTWKPNLRTVRVNVNGENKKMTVCSKCLRASKAQENN
jgi:large subunit ribosomal protein L28